MKKIITIIVLMLITSIGVYAEETRDEKSIELFEEIPTAYIWTIPASLNLSSDNSTFYVEVSEAHLPVNSQLEITVNFDSTKLKQGEANGATLIIKNGGKDTISESIIMTVKSGDGIKSDAYTENFTIEKGPLSAFNYSGKYSLYLVFEANIVANS